MKILLAILLIPALVSGYQIVTITDDDSHYTEVCEWTYQAVPSPITRGVRWGKANCAPDRIFSANFEQVVPPQRK